jgi:hypothetical protein
VNGPQDLQKRRQKQIEMAAMQQHISKVSIRYSVLNCMLIIRKSNQPYATLAKKHGQQTPVLTLSKPAKQTSTTAYPV